MPHDFAHRVQRQVADYGIEKRAQPAQVPQPLGRAAVPLDNPFHP